MSCFIPLYCGITKVPESFEIGRRDVFDRKSAWWAFNFVANLAYPNRCPQTQKQEAAAQRLPRCTG